MKTIKTVGGWVVGSAAMMVLAVSAAQAETKNVPGSACEAIDGKYAQQVVGGFGAVANKSTGASLQVSCPIPAYYPNDFDVEVSVTKGTSASMTCAVVSRNWENSAGTVVSKSQTGTGWQSFWFPSAPSNWGVNSVRCDLPKAGGSGAGTRNLVNAYYYYTN